MPQPQKENTAPFGISLMRSQVLYRAAQGLQGVKLVLACPIVPPIASSLQRSPCITDMLTAQMLPMHSALNNTLTTQMLLMPSPGMTLEFQS